MRGRRKRGTGVAPPRTEGVADFLWGLAITVPEHPLVGRNDGPLASTAGARTAEQHHPASMLPPIAIDVQLSDATTPSPAPPAELATQKRPPTRWPGLAYDSPRQRTHTDWDDHRQAARFAERPCIDELLSRSPSPNLSRELIDEVAWWAKNASRMRGDEWLKPPPPTLAAPSSPAPAEPRPTTPTAPELLFAADARREQGDTASAARSIGGALAIDVDVPGGVERLQEIGPVLARARQLVSPVAREPRQTTAEERAAIAELEGRWQRGERLAALVALRSFTRSSAATGIAIERLLVAERTLSLARREDVELAGEKVTIIFGTAAWLGRSDADIVLPSPLVSRQHLLFTADERGPIARDHASANGTFFDRTGPRLELHVDRPCELRLGGEIEVLAEPFGERGQHLRVRTASGTALLALGASLDLDGFSLHRWQALDLAGWRVEALAGATLNGAPCSGSELARGDRLQSGGLELRV